MKVKICVEFYPKGFSLLGEYSIQEKSFVDEIKCIEWCRRNHEKIGCINNYRTSGRHVSHFEIMDAIRGVEN